MEFFFLISHWRRKSNCRRIVKNCRDCGIARTISLSKRVWANVARGHGYFIWYLFLAQAAILSRAQDLASFTLRCVWRSRQMNLGISAQDPASFVLRCVWRSRHELGYFRPGPCKFCFAVRLKIATWTWVFPSRTLQVLFCGASEDRDMNLNLGISSKEKRLTGLHQNHNFGQVAREFYLVRWQVTVKR